MDQRKNGRVANRQEIGEREVWKKEKVNKWEMPSHAQAGKSTDPPSHVLHVLEIEGLERQLPAFRDGLWEEHLNAPSSTEYPTHTWRSY